MTVEDTVNEVPVVHRDRAERRQGATEGPRRPAVVHAGAGELLDDILRGSRQVERRRSAVQPQPRGGLEHEPSGDVRGDVPVREERRGLSRDAPDHRLTGDGRRARDEVQ